MYWQLTADLIIIPKFILVQQGERLLGRQIVVIMLEGHLIGCFGSLKVVNTLRNPTNVHPDSDIRVSKLLHRGCRRVTR